MSHRDGPPPIFEGDDFLYWKIRIEALHEGTKSEREECYHLVMKKLNAFEMLSKESANKMYPCLNVLVEEVNGLGTNAKPPML